MSLVQIYRAEIASRQTRQLWVYGALALGVHLLGAASLMFWHPRLSNPQASQPRTPLEFIYVKPQATASPPPSNSRRQAQANSRAGGSYDLDRPIQAVTRLGSAAATGSVAATGSAPPALPALPASSESTALATRPVTNPPVTNPPNSPNPPAPQPEPDRRSATANPPAPNLSASRPSAPSLATPSLATPSLAAQLGDPSVSVEGRAGAQLNPNRTAAGAGVDAARDELWGGYLTTLNRAVEQNWRQVSVAATSRTRVQFRVDRQGQVTSLQLLEASGNGLADQAAMQAVQAAAPFAPLPPNATEETLIVNFTFTQWLRPSAP